MILLLEKALSLLETIVIIKLYLPGRVCESHPHNFILEILNDTGIIGLMTIFIPVLILLINLYKEYLLENKGRRNNISNWIYL